MNISEQELQIFSRHLILKEFNEKLFNNLQKKKITIVGLGGIGCPAAQYLVAVGIKILKLIDGDLIQKTNLNRQILYSIYDIGKSKAKTAKKKLHGTNPECKIDTISTHLDSKNINKYLYNSSLVIDATDNWKSMILINQYCVNQSIPLISSSTVGFDSQITLFNNLPTKHLCLQCIFPNKKEPNLARCDSVGVLGTATGIAGLVVAQKTINFFLEKRLDNIMTMINVKTLKIDNLKIKKNAACQYLKKNNQTAKI